MLLNVNIVAGNAATGCELIRCHIIELVAAILQINCGVKFIHGIGGA